MNYLIWWYSNLTDNQKAIVSIVLFAISMAVLVAGRKLNLL